MCNPPLASKKKKKKSLINNQNIYNVENEERNHDSLSPCRSWRCLNAQSWWRAVPMLEPWLCSAHTMVHKTSQSENLKRTTAGLQTQNDPCLKYCRIETKCLNSKDTHPTQQSLPPCTIWCYRAIFQLKCITYTEYSSECGSILI